jgi:hypothetical protein
MRRRKQAQSDVTQLNVDVWGTCNTALSADQCATNMAWFAGALQNTCATELSQQNPMIQQSLTSASPSCLRIRHPTFCIRPSTFCIRRPTLRIRHLSFRTCRS